MSRALSLTCTALLLLVGLGGSAFAGKPSIGVLGLEVVDQNGTPTPADTQAAKELSDGLRARAKAGTGPYQLAPGSDKELIDQKLLNNCDNEAPGCMSAIGNQLGSDILMYGHFEKQGKQYQVTIKVLDVGRKAVLKTSSDLIPVSEASGAALQGWAKKIYGRLTGESSGGTLVVKVSNADRGTILIDGDMKGTISSGTGTVSGLGEGKVRVTVEAEGFRRWEKDVNITSGSVTIPVELEKGSTTDPDQTITGDPNVVGPVVGPERKKKSTLVWKIGMGVGGVAIIGGLYYSWDNYKKYNDLHDEQCRHGLVPDGSTEAECVPAKEMPVWDKAMADKTNAKGDDYARNATYGWVISGVGAAVLGFSVYKVLTSDSGSSKEHAVRGKRQRKDRTFVVTPVASPKGGGATLRVDW
jgi:hypothetical protein